MSKKKIPMHNAKCLLNTNLETIIDKVPLFLGVERIVESTFIYYYYFNSHVTYKKSENF